ncbi:MAG: endo,4-beta-xylanase [Pedobacter sp.]|jgi:endo-1,4-beta-xylanase|nr:endo,4-beta-xylanase [Pedobacter sp.]
MEEDLTPTSQPELSDEKADVIDYVSGSVNYVSGATLKGSFSFPIGTAVVKERLEGSAFSNVLTRDFNSVTVESSLNFSAVHPDEDTWTFEKADAIVDFAIQHKMRVHGSTLLYPGDSMMPAWIKNFDGDKQAWKKLLQNHIETVVNHFKGRIKAWDVANEALKDNGELKNNIWLRNIGTEYIGLAFKYAHEADPDALLFYNDYGQEFGGKKMDKIIEWVTQAKENGVHIDGLGFQTHTVLRIEPERIATNLARAASTGLQIYISELDVSVRYQKPSLFDLDKNLAEQQGDKIKQIVQAYMTSVPKAQQYGITLWGIGDGDSFLNIKNKTDRYDYPLLFDSDYKPKPAYRGFLEAGNN